MGRAFGLKNAHRWPAGFWRRCPRQRELTAQGKTRKWVRARKRRMAELEGSEPGKGGAGEDTQAHRQSGGQLQQATVGV